jgi:hypothetical protein
VNFESIGEMIHSPNYYRSPVHTNRVFGASYSYHLRIPAHIEEYSFPLSKNLLSITQSTLYIPPFIIRRWGQAFINPELVVIDLEQLPVDIYKVIVIHNFLVEDSNPTLNECLASIFLAKQMEHRWEEPEDFPLECRGVEVLGYVDTRVKRILAI